MQRLDGRLVLSPTDLTSHREGRHLTRLDLGVAAGVSGAGRGDDGGLRFVFDSGLEHTSASTWSR